MNETLYFIILDDTFGHDLFLGSQIERILIEGNQLEVASIDEA